MRLAAGARGRSVRHAAVAAVMGVALCVPTPGLAASGGGTTKTQTLSGSCAFSGPITPNPPITVVPKSGPHFSYAGTGSCHGSFDGTAVSAAPITLTFTNVSTAFDTCEFGPDYNLHGTLAVTVGTVTAHFPVTVDLTRLAVAGPFTITTSDGGTGTGLATFTPAAPSTASQCVSGGIAHATLAGSFTTSAALAGTLVPRPASSGQAKHRLHRRLHTRPHRRRHR